MTTTHEQLVAEEMANLPKDMVYGDNEKSAATISPEQLKRFQEIEAAEKAAASQEQEARFKKLQADEDAYYASQSINPLYGAAAGAAAAPLFAGGAKGAQDARAARATEAETFHTARETARARIEAETARQIADLSTPQPHSIDTYLDTQVRNGVMTQAERNSLKTMAQVQHFLNTRVTPAAIAGTNISPGTDFSLPPPGSRSSLMLPAEYHAPTQAVEDARVMQESADRIRARGASEFADRIAELNASRPPAPRVPGAVLRGAIDALPGNKAVRAGLGGMAGERLMESYNKRESNTPEAIASFLAGLGHAGLASLKGKPRFLSGIAAGAGEFLKDRFNTAGQAKELKGSVTELKNHFNDAAAERKAAGGSVQHFDRGGVAKQLIGKGVESLASKVAPSISFNSPAKYLKKFSPEAIQSALGITPTVQNVRQITTPGIYRPNLDIVREANARVMPENPLMNSLWGVTRGDLADIASRPGTIKDPIRELIPKASKNPRGAESADNVMVPQNTERLIDLLRTTEREAPDLYRGMKGWYVLDPMWQRLAKLVGPEEATIRFNRSNMFGGLESPNLDVVNETRRAAAANYMHELGKFDDWQQYGGLKAKVRQEQGLIPELEGVPGRVGHKRASASQRNVIETGEHGMNSPKAPLYISASGTPETGFQTSVPVGDAHWSRGIGLGDVRTGKVSDASVTTPELQALTPWWRDISSSAGLEAVPAQAIGWGAFAPQTGVKTGIGAPKLEIITNLIQQRAAKTGKSPEQVRDEYLLGQERFKQGGEVGGLDALDRAYA